MAAKPIKSLELHFKMIQFLIMVDIKCEGGRQRKPAEVCKVSRYHITSLSHKIDINIHILLTALHTFLIVQVGRICLNIETSYFVGYLFYSRYVYLTFIKKKSNIVGRKYMLSLISAPGL